MGRGVGWLCGWSLVIVARRGQVFRMMSFWERHNVIFVVIFIALIVVDIFLVCVVLVSVVLDDFILDISFCKCSR
jgi:hypothetical protein